MSMSSRKGNSDNCGAAILAASLVKKKYSAPSGSLITYTADILWSVWGVVAATQPLLATLSRVNERHRLARYLRPVTGRRRESRPRHGDQEAGDGNIET